MGVMVDIFWIASIRGCPILQNNNMCWKLGQQRYLSRLRTFYTLLPPILNNTFLTIVLNGANSVQQSFIRADLHQNSSVAVEPCGELEVGGSYHLTVFRHLKCLQFIIQHGCNSTHCNDTTNHSSYNPTSRNTRSRCSRHACRGSYDRDHRL